MPRSSLERLKKILKKYNSGKSVGKRARESGVTVTKAIRLFAEPVDFFAPSAWKLPFSWCLYVFVILQEITEQTMFLCSFVPFFGLRGSISVTQHQIPTPSTEKYCPHVHNKPCVPWSREFYSRMNGRAASTLISARVVACDGLQDAHKLFIVTGAIYCMNEWWQNWPCFGKIFWRSVSRAEREKSFALNILMGPENEKISRLYLRRNCSCTRNYSVILSPTVNEAVR